MGKYLTGEKSILHGWEVAFKTSGLLYCRSLVLVFLISLHRHQDIGLQHRSAPPKVGERKDASDKEAHLRMNGVRLCALVSVVQAKGNGENCHGLSWSDEREQVTPRSGVHAQSLPK